MKKAQTEVIITVLIILLVLAGVFIIYYVMRDLVNPTQEYTINQIVCQDDIFSTNNNIICEASCLLGIANTLHIKDSTTKNQRIELMNQCKVFCDNKMPVKQKCETKEVDEIQICKEVEDCVKDVWDYVDICEGDMRCIKKELDKIECKIIKDVNITKILKCVITPKSDLNEEILNENCECGNKEYSYGANAHPNGYICNSWKCGSYEVTKA